MKITEKCVYLIRVLRFFLHYTQDKNEVSSAYLHCNIFSRSPHYIFLVGLLPSAFSIAHGGWNNKDAQYR